MVFCQSVRTKGGLTMNNFVPSDSKRFNCKLCGTLVMCKLEAQYMVLYRREGKFICEKCGKLFCILNNLCINIFKNITEILSCDTLSGDRMTGDIHEGVTLTRDIYTVTLSTGNICADDVARGATVDVITEGKRINNTVTEETYTGNTVIKVETQTDDAFTGNTHTGDPVSGERHTGGVFTSDTVTEETDIGDITGERSTGDDTLTGNTCTREAVTKDTHTIDLVTEDSCADNTGTGETPKVLIFTEDSFADDTILVDTLTVGMMTKDKHADNTVTGDVYKAHIIVSEDTHANDKITGDTRTTGSTVITRDPLTDDRVTGDTYLGDTDSEATLTCDTDSDDIVTGDTLSGDMITEDAHAVTGETDTGKKHISCVTCGKQFAYVGSLKRHTLTHTGDKPFVCGKCGKRFYQKSNLAEHLHTHNRERKFCCQYCGKWFVAKNFIRHTRLQKCRKEFESGVCGQFFISPSVMKRLMVENEDQKTVAKTLPESTHTAMTNQEDLCTGDTASGDARSGNTVIHTGDTQTAETLKDIHASETLRGTQTLRERQTGKKLMRKTHTVERKQLSQNSITDRGEKKIECRICGKRLSSKDCLKQHLHLHTEKKIFGCEKCGKQFFQKSNLIQHLQIHAVFQCSHCTKQFDVKESLIKHTQTQECKKQFDNGQWGPLYVSQSGHNHCTMVHKGENLLRSTADTDTGEAHTGEIITSDTTPVQTDADETVTKVVPVGQTSRREIQSGEKNFKCNECGKLFSLKGSLKKHILIHTQGKIYCCQICGKRFVQKSNLTQHALTHTGKKEFQCLYCGIQFTYKSNLIRHSKRKRCKKMFDSGEVKSLCISNSAFEQLAVIHERMKLVPQIPENNSTTQADEKNTITDTNKSSKKEFQCLYCGIQFTFKSNLVRHLKRKRCKEMFDSGDSAFQQLAVIHERMKLVPQIPENNSTTRADEKNAITDTNKSNLVTHTGESKLRTHTSKEQFGCIKCGKLFPTRKSLSSHNYRIHKHPQEKKVKKLKCECCGKLFGTKHGLRLHVKVIAGEKDFACDKCGKTFVTKGHFNYHMALHSGERNYVCEYCGRSFTQKGTLSMHIKRHNGQKDFECSSCGKKFYSKNCRDRHYRRIHTQEKEKRRSR